MLEGILVSIACGLAWSISIILWKKIDDNLDPLLINLGKNITGFLLFLVTVSLFAPSMPIIGNEDLKAILISGFIGIGIADALVLRSINFLPASNVALLECLYSPLVILFAIVFLGEGLSVTQVIGISLVLGAVVYIQKPGSMKGQEIAGRLFFKGFLYMLAGLLFMAYGVVLMKPVLADVSLLWVITLRMASGVFASGLVFAFSPGKMNSIKFALASHQKTMLFTSFITSSYIAILLWVMGFKLLSASLSAVLNQTSTIFTVVLAAIFLKEKLTTGRAMATAVAVAGVVVLSI